MPYEGSRIEPRLDVDELDRQVSRAAMPPRRPDPDAFERAFARATIRPERRVPEPPPELPPELLNDRDTIRFERSPLSRGAARPRLVPALLMLGALGTALVAMAFYLG